MCPSHEQASSEVDSRGPSTSPDARNHSQHLHAASGETLSENPTQNVPEFLAHRNCERGQMSNIPQDNVFGTICYAAINNTSSAITGLELLPTFPRGTAESSGDPTRTLLSCLCAKLLHCIQLFSTLWTIACQASLSIGFSRQDYWSRVFMPSPGDLLYSGI